MYLDLFPLRNEIKFKRRNASTGAEAMKFAEQRIAGSIGVREPLAQRGG